VVRWTVVGSLAFTAVVACSHKTGGPEGTGTTSGGGEAGTATGGDGGSVTEGGGSGGSGTSSGEAGADTTSSAGATSSTGGTSATGGEAGAPPASGGGGGTDGDLQYVPVQQRSEGIWPELDQIAPRELAADEAMCRISHYESEGGVFIESWTWQYSKNGDLVVRLTSDNGSSQRTAVFDEQGRYWTYCLAGPDCVLFPEPSAVDWDQEFPYVATCPGSPPDGGFQQAAQDCSAPSSRNEACQDAHPWGLFQFTEDGQVRRVILDTATWREDVDCYADGVLRAYGGVGDMAARRSTFYPDGRLLNSSYVTEDHSSESDFSCDENGWRVEYNLWQRDDYGDSTLIERYAFQGDPLRPEAVDVEFAYSDADCEPPISHSGTLRAALEWTGDSVELHPAETSDPSLESVTWEVTLNPNSLSARLDADGNVVEVYAASRSNLPELGIRYLEPERLGYYTFEGEGACRHGTNPHLFLSHVLPYRPRSLVTKCSTGEVGVGGDRARCP